MKTVYDAVVHIIDSDAIESIADEFYDGDVEEAIKGELSWVKESGLEISIVLNEESKRSLKRRDDE